MSDSQQRTAEIPATWVTEILQLEQNDVRFKAFATDLVSTLEERVRERVPLDWAATQNNLGAVILTLGERTGSMEPRAAAVAAFRAALVEFTPGRVPRKSATTQTNLRIALRALGRA